jgi:hypothetical protein
MQVEAPPARGGARRDASGEGASRTRRKRRSPRSLQVGNPPRLESSEMPQTSQMLMGTRYCAFQTNAYLNRVLAPKRREKG